MKKLNKFTIILIGTYLITTIFSFVVFSGLIKSLSDVQSPVPEAVTDGDKTLFDDSLPKTEACPLSGQLFSKQQRQWWEEHRPLGIMIENHEDSRPQSGITKADVVYEAVAEGGITRFLVVYYCQDAEIVGPVRSARTYYLDFISEYGDYPLYAHVGGANTSGPADALGQIRQYGWQNYNDLNQFSIGFPVFYRDYDRLGRTVATEHTMYSSTTRLWDYAKEERGLSNVDEDGNSWDEDFIPYEYKEDAAEGSRPASQSVSYNAWDGYGDYLATWSYNRSTNSYLRSSGGQPHKDLNNDQQISAKNIILLFMRESRANDGYEGNLHLLYGTTGSGNAVVFQDGKEVKAKWSKKNRTGRLIITDSRGQEIKYNPGLTWFSILPLNTDVDIK